MAAGLAYAAIPDPDGTIHACRQKSNGHLRVIDPAVSSCTNAELPLSWSQTGPAGTAGPAGADGEDGTPGISGYQVVRAETAHDTAFYKFVSVPCPAGKKIIGGGALVFIVTGAITAADPMPTLGSSGIYNGEWYAEAEGTTTHPWWIETQAICANVS